MKLFGCGQRSQIIYNHPIGIMYATLTYTYTMPRKGGIGFSWLHSLPIWIQCTTRMVFPNVGKYMQICILDGMDSACFMLFLNGFRMCFLFEMIFSALDWGYPNRAIGSGPRSVGGHDQLLLSCAPCRASPPVCCANLRTCGGFTGWAWRRGGWLGWLPKKNDQNGTSNTLENEHFEPKDGGGWKIIGWFLGSSRSFSGV